VLEATDGISDAEPLPDGRTQGLEGFVDVPLAPDQTATAGIDVGQGPEAVQLRLEDPIRDDRTLPWPGPDPSAGFEEDPQLYLSRIAVFILVSHVYWA
jgi:hypothetical protein